MVRSRIVWSVYTPNLGLGIIIAAREREQSHLGGSWEGVRESTKEELLSRAEAQQVGA